MDELQEHLEFLLVDKWALQVVNIVCQICTNLILKPIECEQCQNIVCFNCCQRNNFKCVNKCWKKLQDKKVHISYRNIYDTITFKCPNQCQEHLKLNKIEKHITSECKERKIKCTNEDCNLMIVANCLQLHLEVDCEHRLLDCELCNDKIKLMNYDQHLKDECYYRLLTCVVCNHEDTCKNLVENNHSCVYNFKNVIEIIKKQHKTLELKYKDSQNENELLKEEIKSLKAIVQMKENANKNNIIENVTVIQEQRKQEKSNRGGIPKYANGRIRRNLITVPSTIANSRRIIKVKEKTLHDFEKAFNS